MSVRIKKMHPALKHGGFCATGLLPGEDRAAFERLYQDLIAELHPDGPLENDTVLGIARLTWRKQNLETFRIAQSVRERYSVIVSEKVPSTTPPLDIFPLMNPDPDPDWDPPDPADVKAGREAANAQGRKEFGDRYMFVEMGDAATISQMIGDFEVKERLDGMIDKYLKRLLFLRGLKSLPSASSSAPLRSIQGPQKAAWCEQGRCSNHSGCGAGWSARFTARDIDCFRVRADAGALPSSGGQTIPRDNPITLWVHFSNIQLTDVFLQNETDNLR
jgi:hypothetical protein